MAIFYLDPENGNDANDGTTFANRWKTFGSGATAARTAPGDTIRVMASPDPTTPGSATWTDNDGTITWAAAKNKVIDDCETAWTASTNITASTNTGRKQGSVSVSLAPASGFTTGKVAYRTLPVALDLSAFEQVSFWFRPGVLTAAGQVELRLCSDTTGDTAVHTIPIPGGGTNAHWRTVVWDNGAALGSSIQSISLWTTADPGTTPFRIDNIVACAAASSANCVTHEHAIGKNTVGEPEWYAILSIADDSVVLGGYYDVELASSVLPRPYRGVSEAVATYLIAGFKIGGLGISQKSINEGGASDNPITYSGGWNRTDMSSQNGVSYLNVQHAASQAIEISSRSNLLLEGFGALYCKGSAIKDSGSNNLQINLADVVGCRFVFELSSASGGAWDVGFGSMHGSDNLAIISTLSSPRVRIKGRRVHGSCVSSSGAALTPDKGVEYAIARIDNSGGHGVALGSLSDRDSWAILRGCTIENNAGTGDINFASSTRGILRAWDCTYTKLNISGTTESALLLSTRDQGASNSHKVISRYWTAQSATDERHTASGVSWKLNPLSATFASIWNPAFITLAKIACAANELVTVKVWARRDDAGLSVGMRVHGDQIPGVPDDITVLATGAANTWEEITLTFTPTVAGVVEVLGIAYGGTTYSGWLDDLTVTQA